MKPIQTCLLLLAALLAACNRESSGKAPSSGDASGPMAELTSSDLEKAAATITAEGILAAVQSLSDDAMEGRGTGTSGELKAAQWIAGQFREMGLKPLGSDYFQKVELVGYAKKADASSLTLMGENGQIPYENDGTLTYWSTSQKPEIKIEKAPLLFVGYGVEAPEHEWDDFKGAETTGKVLVFLNNDPDVAADPTMFGGNARTYYGRYTYKFEQAVRKGAAGAIMIHTTPSAGYGWSVIGSAGGRESFSLRLPNTGYQLDMLAWMHRDLAETLAATVGSDLNGWFEAANRRDFKPVPLPVSLSTAMEVGLRQVDSQNVLGLWEGADARLKDEVIVFSAHYDHLGMKQGAEGEDRVFNGAWDNASGTACIIEIARTFAINGIRPRRSIAFLACAAEEKGLLGSQWFAARPPVPPHRFVANFNIDMVQILGMTSDMVAIGHDSNSLGRSLRELGGETMVDLGDGTSAPLVIKGDQNPNAGSFYRSDQVNFAKAGVPALFLLPGVDYLTPPSVDPAQFHANVYHQLADQVNEHWNLAGAERDMRLIFQLAYRVAMDEEMPRWNAGNEFENTWKALHGK